MGIAAQVVSGRVTNPGATITALTPDAGDSFTVPTFDQSARASIVRLWTENAAGGVLRIRSPRLHDVAQGIRLQIPAADQVQLIGGPEMQRLYPADPLIVESSGGAAEVDTLAYLMYYSDLPGIQAQLASWAEVQDRIANIVGVEVDLTSGGTAGDYGGSRALNQDFQNLKAGERYALLGYTCRTAFTTLGIRGPDTGNLRIGGPGSTNTWDTATWFIDVSNALGLPCIPIIQADNAGGTQVDLTDTATATARTVSLIFGELPA